MRGVSICHQSIFSSYFQINLKTLHLLLGTDISQVKSWFHLLICSNWIFIFKCKCSCWEIYRLRQAVSSQIHEIRTKYFLFGSKICVWLNYLYAHISEINPDIPMHKISTFVVEILRGGSDCSWLFLLFGLAQMAIDLSSPPCPETKHAPSPTFHSIAFKIICIDKIHCDCYDTVVLVWVKKQNSWAGRLGGLGTSGDADWHKEKVSV